MYNVSAYIWNLIAKFGSQFIWLVTTIILARFLSPDEFGVIGILSLLCMVANTLTESGLGGALVIQKEILKEDCSTISVFNIVVSITIYVIIFILADFIESFYGISNLSEITKVLSLVFVISAFCIVPRTVLFHRLCFKELCVISLAAVLLGALVSICIAWRGGGVYALVAYQLVQASINTIGCILASKYTISFRFYWKSFKKLFSFGFYTTITGVVDTVYENIMTAIYGKFLSVAQAGFLSQAKRIEEASSQSLLMAINNTAFPILAKYKDRIDDFVAEASSIQKTIAYIICPLLFLICVYSQELIQLLFGAQWLPASSYLSVLVLASVFIIFDSLSRNFIKSLGRVEVLLKITIVKRIIGCLLMLIFGLISVHLIIYAYLISAIVGVIINYVTYSKIINTSLLSVIRELLSPFILVLPICFFVFFTHLLLTNIFFNIIVTCITYSLYFFVFLPKNGIDVLSLLKVSINKHRHGTN